MYESQNETILIINMVLSNTKFRMFYSYQIYYKRKRIRIQTNFTKII